MIVALTIIAGGVGAGARYVVSGAVQVLDGRFPVGTMFVNLSGAFAIGMAVGLADPGTVARAAVVGFLGGFTTFSTWSLESLEMLRTGQRVRGGANLVVTLVFGVGLCALGFYLTN